MKTYIKPDSKSIELEIEDSVLLITSPQNNTPSNDDPENQFSKDRSNVNFADEESLF